MKGEGIRPIDLQGAARRLETLTADRIHFEALARFLREMTGVHLTPAPKNMSLMASRLIRVMERHQLPNYASYLRQLREGEPRLRDEFVATMTTHTTQFFRESRHFDLLGQTLGAYLQTRSVSRELRVWCAAASTGQEVYSLLITLLEAAPELLEWDLKCLATDIDTRSLAKGSRGIYSETEAASIPPLYRQKYFRAMRGQEKQYMANDILRKRVTFASFNLMTESYPFRFPFDIVFCRNVLIYFERATACSVISKLGQTMRPAGMLFVGHSEAGLVDHAGYKAENQAFYRRIAV